MDEGGLGEYRSAAQHSAGQLIVQECVRLSLRCRRALLACRWN